MENRKKTRNLSIAEYFLQIQKEYLIADFRRRVYYNPRDKSYWKKVCGYKKERIDEIANRNKLNSIFNSEEKLNELKSELFDLNGKPKWELTPFDLQNYYSNGNEFCFHGEIYILDKVNSDDTLTLYSSSKEEYINASKRDVIRIV